MTSVNNSTGVIDFGPAVARGATTGTALRSLAELARDAGNAPLAVEWRDTAIVAILGQLAATDAAASGKILRGACAVAKAQRSLGGLEAVFMSALLGASPDTPELAVAESVWAAIEGPAGTANDLVPVLNSRSRELCFLTRADISTLSAYELRAQLAELCEAHPVAAGTTDDQIGFGTHLVVAASAVASAHMIRARPDSSTYTAPAVAVLPAGARSDGLPQALLNGTALLVQVCLIRGVNLPSATEPWRSVWPTTPLLPVDNPASALGHAFWDKSKLCPAWPASSLQISQLLVLRGQTLVLPRLPRFDPDGTVVDRGFYPTLGDDEAGAVDGEREWRLRTPGIRSLRLPDPTIDFTGLHHDELTGQLVDVLGRPVGPAPSVAFGEYGAVSAVRTRLVATARNAGLSSNTRLRDVISRILDFDYGP